MKPSTKFGLVLAILVILVLLDHSYWHVLNHIGLTHGCASGACK